MTASPRSRRLDGLEAKWARAVGGRRHLPLRPHEGARRGLLDRHAAADGERVAAHGLGVRVRRRPTRSPATGACAATRSSTRWAGTTTGSPTERRVQNYYGVRCDPSLPYDPDFAPPEKPGEAARSRSSRPNFVELCERLDRRGRAGVRGAVAPARALGRLVADLHDDRRAAPGACRSARSSATSPAARPTRPRRRRCGTSTTAPRSPRPSSRTASTPGAYHRGRASDGVDGARRHRHRDDPARADPGVRRARRAPRRRRATATASAAR